MRNVNLHTVTLLDPNLIDCTALLLLARAVQHCTIGRIGHFFRGFSFLEICTIFQVCRYAYPSSIQHCYISKPSYSVTKCLAEEAQPGGAPETDAATPSLEGGSPGVMRGSQQWLQVCSLKPHPHVSLVDTDLEAEVTPSAEFMERVAAEQVWLLTIRLRNDT